MFKESQQDGEGFDEGRLEHLMLAIFLGASVVMFVLSFRYRYPANLFPQVLSAVVALSSALLLGRDWLPGNLFSDDAAMSLQGEFAAEEAESEMEEQSDNDVRLEEIVLLGMVGAYAISGYIVGLFWVTPLFVLGFLRWQQTPWRTAILLAITSIGIPYLMMEYLNINLLTGGL